jgi:hypothetical protein
VYFFADNKFQAFLDGGAIIGFTVNENCGMSVYFGLFIKNSILRKIFM